MAIALILFEGKQYSMQKAKKRGGITKVLLIAAAVILLLELILVVWLERKDDPPPGSSKPPVSTTEAQKNPVKPPASFETKFAVSDASAEILTFADGQIQTPYFPLHYPEAFSDLLVVAKTAEEPFTLEFYAILDSRPEQRLFDIRLSTQTRGNLGTVKTESGEVFVDLTFYGAATDSSWTEDDINTVLAMQEAANDTISRLNLEEPSGQPAFRETAPESSVINLLSIPTPDCTLRYPARWASCLVTEQTEVSASGAYSVLFYGEIAGKDKVPLFSVIFNGEEGTRLGVLLSGRETSVSLYIYELELDGWNADDAQLLYTMQEAVNDLLRQLPLK